jgi:sodium pump decarboxylase gamma subunit
MLNQGLTLTFAGMATVFSFLILLVLIMSLSSRIILRFFPEKTQIQPPKRTSKPKMDIAIAIAVAKAKKEGII